MGNTFGAALQEMQIPKGNVWWMYTPFETVIPEAGEKASEQFIGE